MRRCDCVIGDASASILARIRSGWRKFSKLLHLLTLRGVSLGGKGHLLVVYVTCVGV